ncbi:MAG: uroporphyrinogen decarboxylase [Calditrichaeota bacterium]|nr:uroporphyrinogen decarboxylase [Calditrichota bacterium]MBT7615731.1 uroporphyrinogen decarboxylase [Calditrichota bacterium]MBT7788497.1 uroporphyrinogen decarboxylase [Calditrichota bacterium]
MKKDEMLYLRAARGEKFEKPPVWLMRQAGRYLPEYNLIRKKFSFLDVCNNPELACEVTMQPIRRFHFDASIMFSDILVPLVPMGAELSFGKGHGPVISNTIRSKSDVDKIKKIEPRESLKHVLESVKMMRAELPGDVALIGFAGAPFTLSSYWVEGGKPDPFANLKGMMYHQPETFINLLEKLGEMVVDYLSALVEAGADAIQLFDTWAGIMPVHEYRKFNLPVLKSIFSGLKHLGVPTTYYAKGSMHLLPEMKNTGADVIGLDWRSPLDEARVTLGAETVLQGNLDPTVLLGSEETIRRETRRILSEVNGSGGHIFNLGHGILPMTPISSVEILLDEIRGHSA